MGEHKMNPLALAAAKAAQQGKELTPIHYQTLPCGLHLEGAGLMVGEDEKTGEVVVQLVLGCVEVSALLGGSRRVPVALGELFRLPGAQTVELFETVLKAANAAAGGGNGVVQGGE